MVEPEDPLLGSDSDLPIHSELQIPQWLYRRHNKILVLRIFGQLSVFLQVCLNNRTDMLLQLSFVYLLFFMLQLGQLLAATCKELPGPKESRRTAKDLWEVVVQICSVSSQHKRGNDGRVSLIKQRESTLGIMYRYVSISFLLLIIYSIHTISRAPTITLIYHKDGQYKDSLQLISNRHV